MRKLIPVALLFSLSLSSYAGGSGKDAKPKAAADAKKAAESKKREQMEELKRNMQMYIDEDNLRRQLGGAQPRFGGESDNSKAATLPAEQNAPRATAAQGGGGEGKSALCGTYEASESCQSASNPADSDEEEPADSDQEDPAGAEFED